MPSNIDSKQRRVAIIGGGISGLSVAWYLQQQAVDADIDVHCTVYEKSNHWGGKVRTEIVETDAGRFVVEAGPDSFLTQKPWALQLARELKLDDELLGTNDESRHVYVLNNSRPIRLPDGVLLIVPTKFMPFALSPLISPLGKLRMGLDLFIPRRADDADETLGDFVRRRLGGEALDKIAEPLMSGIYNAEADKQSLLATFPRFRQLEQKHGSLIRGMLATKRQRPAPSSNGTGKPKMSMFMSLRDGIQRLTDALVGRLNADLCASTTVEALTANPDGTYTLTFDSGQPATVDHVIITTPTYAATDLLRPLAPAAADQLETFRYVSTGTLSLAYPVNALKRPLSGFGMVIPLREKRPINAITISSTKFDHRAPEKHVLLRVFIGGSRNPEAMRLSDDEVLRMVKDQLRELLGVDEAPLFHRLYRWNRANPQYDVGHLDRVDALEASLPAGITLLGSAYRGVGLPDCVQQSQLAAEKIIAALSQSETQRVYS